MDPSSIIQMNEVCYDERVDRSEVALFDTVDVMYAAALDPRHWDDALVQLARLCGAEAAGIRLEGDLCTQRWIGLEPKFNAAYVEHYWRHDPWAAPARAMPTGSAGFGDMIVARRELEKSEFYNELSKPYGLDDLVGGVIKAAPGKLVTLGVMGAKNLRFGADQKLLIERLIPHLGRALSIGERLLCTPTDHPRPTLEERLRCRYGLTRAEASVAVHIGRGRVPKEVAVALGTSWNTVRSQLRRVFEKTKTRRQNELARLISQLEST